MAEALIMGVGPRPCNGMIIGEAPGVEEEKLGKPFVGRSGKLLDEALTMAGISRSQVYITNAYKLRPPGNRNPTDKELAAHAMILYREIGSVDPTFILTLGLIATEVFLSMEHSMGSMRGKVYRNGEYFIMPAFHPAYILRRESEKDVWFGDIGDFARRAFGDKQKGK